MPRSRSHRGGSATPRGWPPSWILAAGAAEAVVTLLHYIAGATDALFDPKRFSLSSEARAVTFNPNADAGFEAGLAIVLAGIRASR